MLDHRKIEAFLAQKIGLKVQQFKINRLLGDASNRTYYRLHFRENGHRGSMILMELAEPEAFKKSEERVTRSTIPVKELPYINILNHLAQSGIAVPKLYDYHKSSGWLLLEDLGDRTMEQEISGKGRDIIQHNYEQAVDELIKIQTDGSQQRNTTCIAFGRTLDAPLLMWEFDHFLEYAIPYYASRPMLPSDYKKIRAQFLKMAEELASLPRIFTHRDYHSRNLMIHNKKIWVLDFQDALMGPHVYDLASLLRDSYTVLDEKQVDNLLAYYLDRIKHPMGQKQGPQAFRRLFDMMSIQRNLKAAGRFVYIHQVKNNPRFLPYVPQTLRYVQSNLDRYPELSIIRSILEPYLQELGPA
jgi:N-acetylmuramate 1-kinase